MRYTRYFNILAVAGLAGAAACSNNDAALSGSALQHAQLSIAQGSSPAMASLASNILYDLDGGGRIRLSMVDSLIVHVSEVDVLPDSLLRQCFPVRGDSAHGFRPMDPDSGRDSVERDSIEQHRPPECRGPGGMGPMGPGLGGGFGGGRFGFPHFDPDSLRPDSGFGRKASDWFTLDVVGDGRLDLVHLPTDSTHALILASGTVPPGDYGAARLLLKDATVYFDTTVTLTDEDSTVFTFKPDTGYSVKFPRMEQKFGFVTNAGFTIPQGGGNVDLIFDAGLTVTGLRANDSGQVMIRPVLRPARHD